MWRTGYGRTHELVARQTTLSYWMLNLMVNEVTIWLERAKWPWWIIAIYLPILCSPIVMSDALIWHYERTMPITFDLGSDMLVSREHHCTWQRIGLKFLMCPFRTKWLGLLHHYQILEEHITEGLSAICFLYSQQRYKNLAVTNIDRSVLNEQPTLRVSQLFRTWRVTCVEELWSNQTCCKTYDGASAVRAASVVRGAAVARRLALLVGFTALGSVNDVMQQQHSSDRQLFRCSRNSPPFMEI